MKRQMLFVILLACVAINPLMVNAIFSLCQKFDIVLDYLKYTILLSYFIYYKDTFSVSFATRRLEKNLKSKGIILPRLEAKFCDNNLIKPICEYLE